MKELECCLRRKTINLQQNFLGYLLSSILAGVCVSIGVMLCYSYAEIFYGMPIQRIAMGIGFSIALNLIMFFNLDLYLGNILLSTYGFFKKMVLFDVMFALCMLSFLGNAIGAVIMSWLYTASGIISPQMMDIIHNAAEYKLSLPWEEIILRGIMCNMLVSMAVALFCILKNKPLKMTFIVILITTFVVLKFEHSIVDVSIFSLCIFNDMVHYGKWSIIGFIFMVGLGNAIGGGVVVAAPLYYLNKIRGMN